MAWPFKIFPSIGVARIGNNRSSSPQDFYVGPEIPNTVIVPPNGYKDSSGQVRRQAGRFRIYGWENGVFMGEITSAGADINRAAGPAKTKAAVNRVEVMRQFGPLRK